MNKKQRQQMILRIISENDVGTQMQLEELLNAQGVRVGQSTLSRDVRELKLKKAPSNNGDMTCYTFNGEYTAHREITYSFIFAQSVISMDMAQNIVVLKCHPGMADAACKLVDEQNFDVVVGSIAGDDTVFILTKNEIHAANLLERLKQLKSRN